MTWVDSTPLDHATITRGDHAAETLAAFSRRCMWRRPPTRRTARTSARTPRDSGGGFEHFLEAMDLDAFGFSCAEDAIRAVWNDAVAAGEWPRPRVWVHRNLHPASVAGAGAGAAIAVVGGPCAAALVTVLVRGAGGIGLPARCGDGPGRSWR